MKHTHKDLLERCIEYIEVGIERGDSYTELTHGLQIEFGTQYSHLRDIFREYTPFPLHSYIKRRLLTEAYIINKARRNEVNTRENFRGINQYINKFKVTFGKSFSEELDIDDLQPALDLDFLFQLYSSLSKIPIVDNFIFDKDAAVISLDERECLLWFMCFKTFLLPILFLEEFERTGDDEKILFLYVVTARLLGEEICVNEDTIIRLQSLSRLYDFDTRKLLGDELYIFSPGIPEHMHKAYMEICSDILPGIKSAIPEYYSLSGHTQLINILSEANSFLEISNSTGMSISESKELVWSYLGLGYLRYKGRRYI